MASPASTPASTPTRTHVTNIVKLMTRPPSSLRYDAPASLPPHRCTRSASSPFAPAGRTRAQAPLAGGGSRRRPVAVLPHQEGGEHLDRSPVQGAVVDHHLHGGARQRPRSGEHTSELQSPPPLPLPPPPPPLPPPRPAARVPPRPRRPPGAPGGSRPLGAGGGPPRGSAAVSPPGGGGVPPSPAGPGGGVVYPPARGGARAPQ